MEEAQVRAEVVKLFEVVAPLSRRILLSKASSKIPDTILSVRPDKQDVWESRPHEKIARWLSNEKGTGVRYSPMAPFGVQNAAGCYSPELNIIWVNSENDDEHKFSTIAHETAHAITYSMLNENMPKGDWARGLRHQKSYSVGEVVAEAASFIVTRQVLHHTTPHSALYIAEYAARERDVVGSLKTALPLATAAALSMIRAIEATDEEVAHGIAT